MAARKMKQASGLNLLPFVVVVVVVLSLFGALSVVVKLVRDGKLRAAAS
jgi:biopolymer transport protein ExbD